MKEAIIYTRVSTEEQAKESHYSLGTQKRICTDFAEKDGYIVIKTFEDAGKSGTNIEGRPALREMLSYVEEHKNLTVLVQDTDRIARNIENHLAIKALLRKNSSNLFSVSQPSFDDTAEGKLMDSITASVNQFQSNITSRKVSKGMEQKAILGWLPGRAPAGYKNVLEETGKLIIVLDPVKAPLIKRAFDLYALGNDGAETINEILYNEGYRTRNNKKLQLSKLYWILDNPFYYGDFRWAGKIYPGNHEPLISKEAWLLVQEIRNTRTLKKHCERKHHFLLSGFIFCCCGRQFTAEYHKDENNNNIYSYYHCTRGKKCQLSSNIPVPNLERQVEERFNEVNFSKPFYDKLTKELKKRFDNYQKYTGQEILVLKNRQGAVQKNINNIENLLIGNTITAEVYKKKSGEYEQELNKIQLEIAKLKTTKVANPDEFSKLVDYSRDISRNYKNGNFETKKRHLAFFWEKFIVEGKTIVEAVPTPLFRALQQLQKPSDGRALVGSEGSKFINPQEWSG